MLGGSAEKVLAAIDRVKLACTSLGLKLNSTKCELVSRDFTFKSKVSAQLPGCKLRNPEEAELLDAPLEQSGSDTSLSLKIDAFEIVCHALIA